MKEKTILIAVPVRSHNYSEISLALTNVLINMKRPKGFNIEVKLSYKQPVDANRNKIVKYFLDKKYEWLLMIDSDVVPPLDILEMIYHKKKIVSAVVMGMQNGVPHPLIMKRRKSGLYSMVNLGEYKDNIRPDGLIEVDGIGCGCLLIHKSVLRKMKPPWFRFEYDKWGNIAYSEDYAFSKKAKKLGYKIYVDTYQIAEHYKKVGLVALNHILYQATQGQIKSETNIGDKNSQEHWDKVWKREGLTSWRKYPQTTKEILKRIPKHSSVLEVGCGSGLLLEKIKKKGCKVFGIDISKESIKLLKKRGIDGKVMKVPPIKLDRRFDYVVCDETLEHIKNPKRLIAEMKRIARKVIIIVPNDILGPDEEPEHYWKWNEKEFKKLVGKYEEYTQFVDKFKTKRRDIEIPLQLVVIKGNVENV